MKKALILYWHGLGDVILLTPILRHLSEIGYEVHLMCRPEVVESNLLAKCPYTSLFIHVDNPWQSSLGFERQRNINIIAFERESRGYDWFAHCLHEHIIHGCKIETNWSECGLISSNKNQQLEVFISPETEKEAMKYISDNYPDGYIFRHTDIEFHSTHDWDSEEWIEDNLPDLPVVNTGFGGNYYCCVPDINFSFVMAREARHRVLSSSVFVHACDAMNATIDVINYGRPDHKVWPKDGSKVIRIRENGRWIK